MKTERILVTGGAGFLGSHLCDRLLGEGAKVIAVDNLATGNKKNLATVLKNKKFRFLKADICQPLPAILKKERFDLIFNLACPASPIHYQRLAKETMAVCSAGVWQIIDLALKNKARLVHFSTSEIYGDPTVHPQKENYLGNVNSYGVRSMYDEGKRFAEALLWTHQKKEGLNAGIVRIFNTYGPRMTREDGRVVSNFIIQALENKPITIYGDGKQTRSFCYVDDLIEGIIRLAKSKEQAPINLGNPGEFTVLELAKKVIKLTTSSSKIIRLPALPDDPGQRNPDINKAKKLLGWSPKVELKEGLAKTIEWFKKGE